MNAVRPLLTRFAALQPRERRLAAIAAALILTALAFVAVEWSLAESRRLARALPDARRDLDSIRRHADELRQLAQRPPRAATDIGLAHRIVEDSARAHGLALRSTLNADRIAVTGAAPLPALLDWLAALQAEHRLQTLRLELHGEGAQWRIEAELGLPASP